MDDDLRAALRKEMWDDFGRVVLWTMLGSMLSHTDNPNQQFNLFVSKWRERTVAKEHEITGGVVTTGEFAEVLNDVVAEFVKIRENGLMEPFTGE